jgi:hypothetical protein
MPAVRLIKKSAFAAEVPDSGCHERKDAPSCMNTPPHPLHRRRWDSRPMVREKQKEGSQLPDNPLRFRPSFPSM